MLLHQDRGADRRRQSPSWCRLSSGPPTSIAG